MNSVSIQPQARRLFVPHILHDWPPAVGELPDVECVVSAADLPCGQETRGIFVDTKLERELINWVELLPLA